MSSQRVNRQERAESDGTIRFGAEEHPRVSVVVVGWRSAPHLLGCLTSLKSHIHSVPYEVIVALNEPEATLLESLGRDVDGIRILSSPVNLGFGAACNRAAAAGRGELVVLLNDDAVVLEGWLEALVEAAEQNDQAGAVGSRILLDDGTVQEEGAVIWADGATTLIGYKRAANSSSDLRLRRVDYCSAASLLVRRDAWESVGGFDPGYFPAYCEDVDLCLKIEARGQMVLYQPRSTVVHRSGSSTSAPYKAFLAQHNRKRLAARWAPALALHEPPQQDSSEAIARAVRLGESRPLPLPGPLPLSDRSEPLPVTDEDYLRKQSHILSAYVARLEEQIAVGDAAHGDLEKLLAEEREEVHRLHQAVEDLHASERYLQEQLTDVQEQLADVQGQARDVQAELDFVTSRRRHQMVDRLYDFTKSVPGFSRAMQRMAARHHATPPGDSG